MVTWYVGKLDTLKQCACLRIPGEKQLKPYVPREVYSLIKVAPVASVRRADISIILSYCQHSAVSLVFLNLYINLISQQNELSSIKMT